MTVSAGYYHFSSNGEKFRNKWDDFDVEVSCLPTLGPEGSGPRTFPNVYKRVARLLLQWSIIPSQCLMASLRGHLSLAQRNEKIEYKTPG